MSDFRWLDEILIGLQDSDLIHNLHPLQGTKLTVEGQVWIGADKVTIRIGLGPRFALQLPKFFLRPWDALGFIPHVDTTGTICFADPEGLLFDRRKPVSLTLEALQRAIQVLKDGATGANKKDFVEEFDSHWRRIEDAKQAISIFAPKDEICQVIVASDKATGAMYVADSESSINNFYGTQNRQGQLTIENELSIPLENETLIAPS